MRKIFLPEQFVQAHSDTPEIKAEFANKFVDFVLSGFPRSKFTKQFYVRLSMCFGMIAHYNIEGFYSEFFCAPEDTVKFVEQCVEWGNGGSPSFTYSDVERSLQKWLKENHVLEAAWGKAYAAREKEERATLARLKDKYEKGDLPV